jgi:general secretion pathway protein H
LNRSRSARGFTLIELLIVVVIIGVITAGAVLAVSVIGQDRELETETERLAGLLNYAREQAELQTRELGLECTARGYEFLAFDPRRGMWVNVEEDDALRARELPEGLRMRLAIEAREVVLTKPKEKDEAKRQPHLMIFSNGDLTDFELTLEREGTDRKLILRADDQGKIRVPDPDERAPRKKT